MATRLAHVSHKSGRAVAIVGAGFSGTLLALHLLRAGPPELTVILLERAGGFGRGLAYGTRNPRHLLNVRVGNMSAWPDDPGHLARWLSANSESVRTSAFIGRGDYGAYLAAQLRHAVRGPDGAGRLLLEADEVTAVKRAGARTRLTLAMGRTIEADVVVLAVGNLPPPPPSGLAALPPALYAGDPWGAGAFEDLAEDAPVLLLGSGLTMVDAAIELDARGHVGPILALSRRGLIPRRYGDAPPDLSRTRPATAGPLSARLAEVRRRARETDWRTAVDELRPHVQATWRAASEVERRRFLRHLRPWWDVHRHRMAPAIAEWFDRRRADGRLTVAAGRLIGATPDEDIVRVAWRPRGSTADSAWRGARIVNCSGVGADLARTRHPLLRGLIDGGFARLDPLALGLEIDGEGRVVDAAGRPDPALYAVGPITRGALWEITAVPDIRGQVAELAARLVTRLSGE